MGTASLSEHKVQRRPPRVGLSLSFKEGVLTTFACDQSATFYVSLFDTDHL